MQLDAMAHAAGAADADQGRGLYDNVVFPALIATAVLVGALDGLCQVIREVCAR